MNDQKTNNTDDNSTIQNLKHLKVHKESNNDDILREMAMQKIKDKIESLQLQIIKEVDKKLSYLSEEILNEVKRLDLQSNELKQLFQDENNKNLTNRRRSDKSGILPEKEFFARNSLLTDLFEVKHIRTIYHIFIVGMLILVLNTVIHDFAAKGTINLGFSTINQVFGNFHIGLGLWSILQLIVFTVHPFLKFWANGRQQLTNGQCIWDSVWLCGFVIFQIGILLLGIKSVVLFNLDKASSVSLLMESVRFIMKSHSFIRTNVPKVIQGKLKTDTKTFSPVVLPAFTQWLYFLFAPTLIYRDSYPRTRKIRWGVAARHFLEVIGVIFYLSFIFERFLIHTFKDFGLVEIQPKELVLMVFQGMLSGMLIFVCGFYCLLHAWHNGTAELLRFADRMFYKDWWNASSFDVYYRTWNIIVHDWLYTYIYKDVYEIVLKGSKFGATLVTFTISAIVHELILGFAFRFFYPILFIFFEGAGVIFVFLNTKKHKSIGNIFMWFCLCFGNGVINSMYSMEISARRNCIVEDSFWSYFIPVSWKCNGMVINADWQFINPLANY